MNSVKYLILGAGPAGLTFARMLKDRGENSFLVLEKEKFGGQIDGYAGNTLLAFGQFHTFAQKFADKVDIVLLSNDVLEWSEYLTEYYEMNQYFQDKIVSGAVHMRKPEERIYTYTLERLGRSAEDCIFVDNSSKNLLVAERFGIQTVLFNRDGEEYDGVVVNNFVELAGYLEQNVFKNMVH